MPIGNRPLHPKVASPSRESSQFLPRRARRRTQFLQRAEPVAGAGVHRRSRCAAEEARGAPART
jgi:hypothetical protein